MTPRSISEVVALLITVAIVIGVTLAVALISGSITQSFTPKGSALLIQNIKVYLVPSSSSSSVLLIKVVASVTGTTHITISNVTVIWSSGSGTVTPQAPAPGTYLKPGSIIEIQAVLQTSSPPASYSTVSVMISYCDSTGTCGSVAGTATVVPYTS